MIDFNNATFAKLRPVSDKTYASTISPMLVPGEEIIASYKGVWDGVVFTNKRIFVVNINGFTGKKKDFTSLAYRKIRAYSVETAGAVDSDSALELWFTGMGKIKLEFVSSANVSEICRLISMQVL